MNGQQVNPFALDPRLQQLMGNAATTNNGYSPSTMSLIIVQDDQTVVQWKMGPSQTNAFYNPNSGLMYLKRSDEFGIPGKIRKFKVTEIIEEPEPNQNGMVTRDEFNELSAVCRDIQKNLQELMK